MGSAATASGRPPLDPGAEEVVSHKLLRLQGGEQCRVLDLFAGCGGFSLGLHRAGCQILGGVEIDPHAARSHAINFHGGLERSDPELFEKHAAPRDITELSPLAFVQKLGHQRPELAVDVLVGGPPCPSFTRVGRAKLREIHNHPEAFKRDPRSQLYLPYLGFVEELRPLALVMENVPDIMNFGGHNLAEEICEVLEDDGYRTAYSLLNAANYGVPEMRERFILIGVHELADVDPRSMFPAALNHVRFPPGYKGSRDVAQKLLRSARQSSLFEVRTRWTPTPSQGHLDPDRHAPITVQEAVRDLPPILGHLDGSLKKGRRDLSDAGAVPYPEDAETNASTFVREHIWNWPGFESGPTRDRLRAHVIRSLSHRDYRLFRTMRPGWQYPEAYRRALEFFSEYVRSIHGRRSALPEETEAGQRLATALRDLALTVRGALLAQLGELPADTLDRWSALEDDVVQLEAHKASLAAALTTLRRGEDHPEDTAVVADLHERWSSIRSTLTAWSDKGLALDAELTRRLTLRLLRHRRVRQAYDAVHRREYGEAPLAYSVLDVDDSASVAELKKQLHEWSDQAAADPNPRSAVATEGLYWLIVDFSQQLGEHQRLKQQFVPPYDPGKFPNKWRKMEPDWPARTLMAHLGKDSYSHIHYDGEQARTLSVREAARLQSFPDGFRFSGSMNPGFRQIGNAVPPLMAFELGKSVLAGLLGKNARQALSGHDQVHELAGSPRQA